MAIINILKRLYTAIGIVIILSVCDNYFGKAKILPIPPTVFALLFLLSLVLELFAIDLKSRPKFHLISSVFKNNLLVIAPFFLIAFFSLLGAMHPTAYWSSNGTWIYLNSYNFIILILSMLLPCLPYIRNNYRLFSILALALALWSVASDVMTPGTFSVEINRPAGFAGNSNWGALSIVMLTVGSLSYNSKKSLLVDIIILMSAGWAIVSTLSRSGSMNFVVLFLVYVYLTYFTAGGDRRRGGILAMVVVVISCFWVIYVVGGDDSEQVTIQNHSQSRLSGFFKGEIKDDGSGEARKGAALHALELIDDSPFFGHGTGFSRTMPEKPHNMYLNQGVNNGIFGIVSYLLLLIGSVWHFFRYRYYRGIALICVVFIGSFFSHNILEQRTFLLLLGLMSTVSWMRNYRQIENGF